MSFISSICSRIIKPLVSTVKKLPAQTGNGSVSIFNGLSKGAATQTAGKALSKTVKGGIIIDALFQIPNLITTIKDKGIMEGVGEALKSGVKITAGTIGGMIGTAIGGPIGSVVGYMAGSWLAGKIVGKSYTEKKEEAEAQQQAQAEIYNQQQQEIQQPQYNPFMYQPPYQMYQMA